MPEFSLETECLAHSPAARCFTVTAGPQGEVTTISAAVGAGGANIPADVRTIQEALNEVGPSRGGPEAPLVADGLIGPLTRTAITRFQRAHVAIVDTRVDPNGPTLAALNAELDAGVDVAAQGLVGAGGKRRRKPEFQPPDATIVATIVALMTRVRAVIRAARFQLDTANPFVRAGEPIKSPTGPFQANVRLSLRLLNAVFNLDKFKNPRPPFENIRRAFGNMDVALNRSFETAPLIAPTLFVPNTHFSMEDKAAAYTSAGGAFLSSKVKLQNLGEPADRIYLCRNLANETEINQISVVVHELAHFISGQPIKIEDMVKQGRMLNPTQKPAFDAIKPADKIRSAEHYAFFAVVASFPRLIPPG